MCNAARGEPTLNDVDLARSILRHLGHAISESREPGADDRVDRVAGIISASHFVGVTNVAPPDWAIVPMERTPEMVEAGNAAYEKSMLGKRDCIRADSQRWAAQLSAAPKPPPHSPTGRVNADDDSLRSHALEMIRVCDEWLAMHAEYVRVKDIERWTYAPEVEDLRERLVAVSEGRVVLKEEKTHG